MYPISIASGIREQPIQCCTEGTGPSYLALDAPNLGSQDAMHPLPEFVTIASRHLTYTYLLCFPHTCFVFLLPIRNVSSHVVLLNVLYKFSSSLAFRRPSNGLDSGSLILFARPSVWFEEVAPVHSNLSNTVTLSRTKFKEIY